MSTIVLRSIKGSALTYAEADANFNNLNNDKLEATSPLSSANLTGALPAISGAALTSLNASNLGSGTVPLARLSSIADAQIDVAAAIAWTKISKTGSSLADLVTRSAADLSSGTLPDARFPATLPAASGVNLTALNASNLGSGTVPDARFPATLPAISGANLTNLNGTNISSGTVANARLPSTISQIILASAEYDAGNSSTALTITWTNGNNQKVTLTGACTFTFASPTAGTTIKLKLVQDGTGGRLVTWPTIKWAAGTAPVLSTAASAIDFVTLYYDGTTYFGQWATGFA